MRSGDVIAGKYLLEERLGSGGHAQVWRATWQVGGRDFGAVAIKFFHAEANVGELQLLTRLRHENLIALRGIEEHEGSLCGIMDFAEGGSAEALLRAYPDGVPAAQVGPILSQVCAALAYLHGESVVHRDVKPANIVFGGTRAMLCDVGISRAMERGRATHTGQGTMAYTPPELFQRGGVITAAVDVWALGVTALLG